MAKTINQIDVMNSLHNLMGHRVAPGGTDDDLARYVQSSFDYCWRYYKWTFSLKTAEVAEDGILPSDFDYEGYRLFDGVTEVNLEDTISSSNSGSAVVWDFDLKKYKLSPAVACTVVYQVTPPTLGTDANGSAPFPSAQVVALGATVYSKQAENPTRADISQEWDLFHAELDRLVGRADNNRNTKARRPQSYHDKMGTFLGDVGQ